jgi:hypothetical protein
VKGAVETDPVLRFVDTLLSDLSARSVMFVGRRPQDGDGSTFVIQTGEEGRCRLSLPNVGLPISIEQVAAAAQAHLERALSEPVPRCPLHGHSLDARAQGVGLEWVCPDGESRCELGDYEERTWPQLDGPSLAPILSRRLARRGIGSIATIGLRQTDHRLTAHFGVSQVTLELVEKLRDAAAPVPIDVHREPRRFIRV